MEVLENDSSQTNGVPASAPRIAGHRGRGPGGFQLLAGGPAFASTGHAIPSVHKGRCTPINPPRNVKTCITVTYAATHPKPQLTDVFASALPIFTRADLLICAYYPDDVVIKCSNNGNYEWHDPGHPLLLNIPFPHRHPKGEYCARTFQKMANGSEPMVGKACAPFP